MFLFFKAAALVTDDDRMTNCRLVLSIDEDIKCTEVLIAVFQCDETWQLSATSEKSPQRLLTDLRYM